MAPVSLTREGVPELPGRVFPRLGGGPQTVGTPREFLDPVEARFGTISLDLCASSENACAPVYLSEQTDSLKADWSALVRGIAWCNPPFGDIAPWVKKAADTALLPGNKILVLVPASVGSNWFRDAVFRKAHVYFLNGRVLFAGHTTRYPKDLMLCVYGEPPGVEIWTWPAKNSLRPDASGATKKRAATKGEST